MNLSELKKQFEASRSKQVKATTTSSESSKKNDPRILEWKAGHTYKGRLIYWYPEGGQRKDPFIYQYQHSFFDKENKQYGQIICPSSDYINGRQGFDKCLVCKEVNEIYKDYDKNANDGKGVWKTSISEQIYKTFKRSFHGYALIYVVSDTFKEENNGHIKIMTFGDKVGQFLKRKIYGLEKIDGKFKPVKDEDSVIGFSAFDLENGLNFSISVKSNPNNSKWNEYIPEFSMKPNSIHKSFEEIEAELKALNFDRDFYRESTQEDIQKFSTSFLFKNTVQEDSMARNDNPMPPDDDIPMETFKEETKKPSVKKIEETKLPVKTEESYDDFGDILDNILGNQ